MITRFFLVAQREPELQIHYGSVFGSPKAAEVITPQTFEAKSPVGDIFFFLQVIYDPQRPVMIRSFARYLI
jgi:hypothetical protein